MAPAGLGHRRGWAWIKNYLPSSLFLIYYTRKREDRGTLYILYWILKKQKIVKYYVKVKQTKIKWHIYQG